MRRPIVNIVNFDGIDYCVTENTRRLYVSLGCRCVVSRRAMPADVLVILRGVVPEIDCAGYQDIHVFNYVGQDRSRTNLRNPRRLAFVEASTSLADLRPQGGNAERATIHGWHPVYPEMWKRVPAGIRFHCSHIGNRKYYPTQEGEDPIRAALLDCIVQSRAIVWGLGWDDVVPAAQRMGESSLWNVPTLFAMTRVTLGFRYPYQRQHKLISGRYWLAPLCGCPVISEEPPLDENIPGVHFRSYATADSLVMDDAQRNALAEAAAEYWTYKTALLTVAMRERLAVVDPVTRPMWSHAIAQSSYFLEKSMKRLFPNVARWLQKQFRDYVTHRQ